MLVPRGLQLEPTPCPAPQGQLPFCRATFSTLKREVGRVGSQCVSGPVEVLETISLSSKELGERWEIVLSPHNPLSGL